MLENLIFSVNSVVPLFMVLAVGYIIRKRGLTDAATNRKMNTVVFSLALPVMFFRDVSSSSIGDFFDGAFVMYSILTTTLIFVSSFALATAYFKDRKVAGTFSQACFRSNFAVLSLPLVAHILGGNDTGVGLLVVIFIIPIYNTFSAIALAGKGDEKLRGLSGLKIIVKNIFNPLMIGVLIGFVVSLTGISLPVIVNVPVEYIARMATPLALLIIGGSIDFSKMRSRYKPALVVALVKLVITPLVFVPPAIWLGFDSESVLVLYLMYGSPTAIASYALVCNMGGDEELALNALLFTMVLSMFSFTIGLFLLRTFGII